MTINGIITRIKYFFQYGKVDNLVEKYRKNGVLIRRKRQSY